jgi:multiple sugar transport system substrate-binding protein
VRLAEVRSAGILTPLDASIAQDPRFNLRDFFPAMIRSMTFGGRLYALPRSNQAVMLYYNTAKFDDAGIAYPNETWTWDNEFLAAARTLTRWTDANRAGFFGLQPIGKNEQFYMPSVWANGASLLDSTGRTFAMDSPRASAGLQFMADLTCQWAVTGGSMHTGTAAMVIANNTNTRNFADAHLGTFDIEHLPLGTASRATTVDGAAYSIAATTAHPGEAWEFLKFMVSVEAMTDLMLERPWLVPTRAGLASNFLKPVPHHPRPRNQKAILDAMSYARSPYEGGEKWEEIGKNLSNALAPVWQGQEAASIALTRVAPVIQAILDR